MKTNIVLCTCGGTLTQNLDYSVITEYLRDHVPNAEIHQTDRLCLSEGKKWMQKLISASPSTPLLLGACTFQTLSHIVKPLNPEKVAYANLREQTAWVIKDPSKSTKKAIVELLRANAQLSHTSTIQDIPIPHNRTILIVGSGYAGLNMAHSLETLGLKPLLIDKAAYPGGMAASLLTPFQNEPEEKKRFSQLIKKALSRANKSLFLNSEIVQVTGGPGQFHVAIQQKPPFITGKLLNEQAAIDACPVIVPDEYTAKVTKRKAIYKNPVTGKMQIDSASCILCGKCAEASKGIDLAAKPVPFEFDVGAIVLATGIEEASPPDEPPYHGATPNVITQSQLEFLLRQSQKGSLRTEAGSPITRVHMIQCVGSRNTQNPRCSKLCCTYAIKNALTLRERGIDVSISYLDIRTPWLDEHLYREARQKGVQFLKGTVVEIAPGETSPLTAKLENILDQEVQSVATDLIVLSTAINPSSTNSSLAQVLGLHTTRSGFIDSLYPKLKNHETTRHGIWMLGSAGAITPIHEILEESRQIGVEIYKFLTSHAKQGLVPLINDALCTKCQACSRICPANALKVTLSTITLDALACKGCGQCQSVCPTGAIELTNYTPDTITSQLDAISQTHNLVYTDQTPFFVNLGCIECSYCAADMVGAAGKTLPHNLYTIPQPCGGETSVLHILLALEKGAEGVLVTSCPTHSCHYYNGARTAAATVEFAQAILEAIGRPRTSVQYVPVLFSEPHKYAQAANRFAQPKGGLPL